MAISAGVAVTALHGIPNTDLQAVEAGIVWTSDQFGDPICSLDYLPLNNINTWNQIYASDSGGYDAWTPFELDMIFCTPTKIVDSVHHLRFKKVAGTFSPQIQYEDENNNILHTSVLSSNFNCSKVDNATPPPMYGKESQVRFQLVVYDNNGNYDIGFAMCNDITSLARSQQALLNPYYLQCTPNSDGFTEQWITGIIGDDIWSASSGGAGGQAGKEGDPAGGDGEFFRNDIDIPFSEIPTISAAASGFISLYKVTESQLQNLAADLWDSNFFNSLVKNFSNPFDNIISLGMIPYDGVIGTLQNIQIGDYQCPVAAGDKLSTNYFILNCGVVSVKEYYRHFGDYDTKIQLFLPYCGTIDIEPAECMDGNIEVQYIFDIFSGSCVAQVMCYTGRAHHVLYNKEGNIRSEIPYSGRDFAEYYKGIISGISSMALGAATIAASGGLAAPALGVAGTAIAGANMGMSGASTMMWNKPSVMRSGNVSGTAGLIGIQTPYLIYTTPNYFSGKSIGQYCGYVSNLLCTIGDETGYISADVDFEILQDFDGATLEEMEMIKSALAEGIYIS